MPTTARAVRREHVESYFARRRDEVKPTTLSIEFRALQQFWRWALDEDEVWLRPRRRPADALCGRVDNVAAFARLTGHEEWMEYREPEPRRARCRACQGHSVGGRSAVTPRVLAKIRSHKT